MDGDDNVFDTVYSQDNVILVVNRSALLIPFCETLFCLSLDVRLHEWSDKF